MLKKALHIKILIFIAVVIAAFLVFYRIQPAKTQWLDGWSYRGTILVKEESGELLKNYQIKVVLNSRWFDFTLLKPDGSDLRFTDTDGKQLSYWIEKWPESVETSGNAVVWVKIPELKPFEKKEIFMYYGNKTASSYSNMSATMDFIEVLKSTINSTPTTIPFNFDNDVVIASPPEGTSSETCTILTYKEKGKFKAVITEPSLADNIHEPETAYFIGSKAGSYLIGDAVLNFSTEAVSSFISKNTTSYPFIKFFTADLSNDFAVFSTIMSAPSNDAQMRLLFSRNLLSLPYGASVVLNMESDNTTSTLNSVLTGFLRFESKTNSASAFEATTEKYLNIVHASTETAEQRILLPDNSILFASIETSKNTSIFPYIARQNERFLELRTDEIAGNGNGSLKKLDILAFPATGVYVASKFVNPQPRVSFKNISGLVFEDKNISFNYETTEDAPLKNVFLRLYEDLNENGKIDDGDVIIAETKTDENGEFYFPAKQGKKYLIAASALSAGKTISLNGGDIPLIPEQTCVSEFSQGKSIVVKKPGGESPQVTDMWSDDPDPVFNVYEHVARVDLSSSNEATGIVFGFSPTLVVTTFDSPYLPSQGSLRQAVVNASYFSGSKIAFYLSKNDPSYSETLDEFVINLSKELPPLTSSCEVDGKNLCEEAKNSSIIISGAGKNLRTGFIVSSPDVKIRNLKISGFEEGIVFEVPQLEKPVNLAELKKQNVFLRVYAHDEGLTPFDPTSRSILPFATKKLLQDEKTVYGLKLPSSQKLSFLQRLKPVPWENDFSFEPFEVNGFSNGTQTDIINGVKASELKLNNSYFVLPEKSSKAVLHENGDLFTIKTGSSVFPDLKGGFAKNKFFGKHFIVPVLKGFSVFFASTTQTQANIKEFFRSDVFTDSITTLPASKNAQEVDEVVAASSENNFGAVLNTGSSAVPVPPASLQLAGITGVDMLVCADENTDITFFMKREDGASGIFEKTIEQGKVYRLSDFEDIKLWLNGKTAAVFAISEKPFSIIGALESDGISSYVPFLPVEMLSQNWFSNLSSDEILVADFSGASVNISGSPSATITMTGIITEPDLKMISVNSDHLDLHASKPVFVLIKEKLTGKYIIPDSLDDFFPQTDGLELNNNSVYAFNANILVENCSFIAAGKGIVASEGTGIKAFNNRYINCMNPIDIGDDGKDEPDNKISIFEPNLGVDPPVLTSAVYEEGTITITGYIGSTESATFDSGLVEIYVSDKSGEPLFKLGEAEVNNGNFTYLKKLEGYKPDASDFVVAVFTFKDGSTSEFSEPIRIDPAPVIYEVNATHITPLSETTPEANATTITWYTDIPSTSKVVYDVVSHASTETYAFETTETTELTTTHTVVLNNLLTNTIYYFRVISRNEYGDTAISYEFMIPPGRTAADTDLCAACHRAHTGMQKPLRLPYYVRP